MKTFQVVPLAHKQPLLFDTTASGLVDEAASLIDRRASVARHIISTVTPEEATYENVIVPIVNDENARSARENFIRFHASTSPSQDLRDASYKSATMLNDADTDFYSQRNLFHVINSVMTKAQTSTLFSLDAESMHHLSKLHRRFTVNGCGIPDDTMRSTFVAKKKRIDELVKGCRRSLASEKTGLWLTRDELHGLPDSLLNRLNSGEGDHAGMLWLPTNAPFSLPAITNATSDSARKKIHYATMNRNPQNVAMFREIILLRDETARMLGWPNHFAFKTSQKMVQTPTVIQELLEHIANGLQPIAENFATKLLNIKVDEAVARGESAEDIKLYFWDRQYLQKKMNDKKSSINIPTSEYFELDTTIHKLLGMYEQLFGVRLIPVDTTSELAAAKKYVWHEDVRMFSAWKIDNDTPDFLAYTYMDLYPREGKYTHSGHYNLQQGFQRPDGTWHQPCSCLVLNYMKPRADKPSLLSLDNVRSLFHELGHMYHNILSRSKFATLHSVDSDFVEAPSMMLEQFFWDAEIIQNVSHHYSHISPAMHSVWLSSHPDHQSKGGELTVPIQLTKAEATDLATTNAAQFIPLVLDLVFFTTYDMVVHSPVTHEDLLATNLCELFNKTRTQIYHMQGGEAFGEGWEFAHGETTFRGIIGKHDAGYYAYILGRLFGLNIFKAGFSGDLMNQQNARKYRDMVLSKGGSQAEMKTLTDYLGHEPDATLFLQWLGA